MPILIKDVKWSQTEYEVKIVLKLSNKPTQPVDIFTSRKYLKVHSPPFLWESFMLHEIENDKSRCQIISGLVQFSLKKSESIHWDSLEKELEHHEKTVIREEAIKHKQESIIKKQKEIVIYKEQKKREEIMKSTSRDARTRENYQKTIKGAIQKELESNGICANEVKNNTQLHLHSEKEEVKSASLRPITDTSLEKLAPLPAVRKSTNIAISFSNRNFITPKRESQEDEERQWLLKQKEARKATGFVEEDLRPEERNPRWLKEKGDHFYKQGNYLAAISAFSVAIRISDQYWELFMNRAAAHFSAENFQKCVSTYLNLFYFNISHKFHVY